jgi:hypothetical protein
MSYMTTTSERITARKKTTRKKVTKKVTKKTTIRKTTRKKVTRKKVTRKGSDVRAAARAVMGSTDKGRGEKGSISRWFRNNPAAREFVEEWVEMAIKGETTWSSAHLFNHLREVYPSFTGENSALNRWGHRTFGQRYKQAIHGVES